MNGFPSYMGSGRGFRMSGIGCFGFLFVLVLVVGLVFQFIYYRSHTVTATVCEKERSATKGGGEYRIYTADRGTFVIKDMHWPGHWRTNSADIYGKLHVPGTYRMSYVGFRFSLNSTFPNIENFTRLPANEQQLAKCA